MMKLLLDIVPANSIQALIVDHARSDDRRRNL